MPTERLKTFGKAEEEQCASSESTKVTCLERCTDTEITKSLEFIYETPDAPVDPEEQGPANQWTFGDLCRGLTPLSLTKIWQRLFKVTESVAAFIAHSFVDYIELESYEVLWKDRCTATVAWEKRRGITPRKKKGPTQGPRGSWSDGYGFSCPADACLCGALFADHQEQRCPGAQNDTAAADASLLDSMAGRRNLGVMERMGRIPFR